MTVTGLHKMVYFVCAERMRTESMRIDIISTVCVRANAGECELWRDVAS